jgi:hypothetical protein
MTFVFGRKRLVISLTAAQPEKNGDRYPMAYAATDRELERLNRLGIGAADRMGDDVRRVMYGVGSVR